MLCYVTVYPNCIGSANIQWTRASQEKLISTAWHYPLDKSRDNTIGFDSTNQKDGDLQYLLDTSIQPKINQVLGTWSEVS